jgi:hypothetical protein
VTASLEPVVVSSSEGKELLVFPRAVLFIRMVWLCVELKIKEQQMLLKTHSIHHDCISVKTS